MCPPVEYETVEQSMKHSKSSSRHFKTKNEDSLAHLSQVYIKMKDAEKAKDQSFKSRKNSVTSEKMITGKDGRKPSVRESRGMPTIVDSKKGTTARQSKK